MIVAALRALTEAVVAAELRGAGGAAEVFGAVTAAFGANA
jgi:hypothetical protein